MSQKIPSNQIQVLFDNKLHKIYGNIGRLLLSITFQAINLRACFKTITDLNRKLQY